MAVFCWLSKAQQLQNASYIMLTCNMLKRNRHYLISMKQILVSFRKQRCILSLTIVDHSCPHLAFLLTGVPVMRLTLLVSKCGQTLRTWQPFTHFVLYAGLLTVLPSWTGPGEPQPQEIQLNLLLYDLNLKTKHEDHRGLRRGDVRRGSGSVTEVKLNMTEQRF